MDVGRETNLGMEFARRSLSCHHTQTAMDVVMHMECTINRPLHYTLPVCQRCGTLLVAGGPALHFHPQLPPDWDLYY